MARGRPRIQSIPRFNIATDLTGGKKFLRFKRELKCSEEKAFTILVRFWQFVAINYAFSPRLNEADEDVLAEFCFFPEFSTEKDGKEITLIGALKKAGFLDPDLTVHDWPNHQPLAEKIATYRERKSQEPQERKENIPEFSTEKERKLPTTSERNFGKELLKGTSEKAKSEERRATPVSNADPELIEATSEFLDELAEIWKLTENDRRGIRSDVYFHGRVDDLGFIADQLRAARSDKRLGNVPGISNPVGWIREQIRKQTESVPARASP